jgi:light-independent protochlorophyllide reductase subunit B
MGFEGANVLFDTWVHPLMMGLEEHLLTMFRGDFEFHDGAAASHLGHATKPQPAASPAEPQAASVVAVAVEAPAPLAAAAAAAVTPAPESVIVVPSWTNDAQKELGKIPFFVRGKARRNTERFATERGMGVITVETLYDAKAHFGR